MKSDDRFWQVEGRTSPKSRHTGLTTTARIETRAASASLRSVALFEAGKAILLVMLGCGMFDLIHKNVDAIAEQIAFMFRVNPHGELSNAFMKLASHATDHTLWILAIWALFDAGVRLIAAYGLWRERAWGLWFELLLTALYLPPEFYLLLRHPDWLKGGALTINIGIMLMMLWFCLAIRVPQNTRRVVPESESVRKFPQNATLSDLRRRHDA